MQKFSAGKFHDNSSGGPHNAEGHGNGWKDEFSDGSPAAGTIAAFNSRNVGMSRWQL
jgi:hypothetical protein